MASASSNLVKEIFRAVGGMRYVSIFRNNTAMAWAGKISRMKNKVDVIVHNARPIHAGLIKGSSDHIGWTSIVIQPQDVGRRIAIFTAIEAKEGTGRLEPEQETFIRNVLAAGGIAGVARSAEEAVAIIENWAEK